MSTAPATQETKVAAPASPKRKFQQLVDSAQFKEQIVAALPKHLTPERFIRTLMTATIKTPDLLNCTEETLFKCIFDAAAIGLEIDGRRAHLIPLRNRQKQGQPLEANLWLDYKGIAELVMRSGVVSSIHADIVCDNDTFEYDRGELKAHKIDFKQERGKMYAAYCIIRMKDGGEKVEVMPKHAIDAVRMKSPGKNSPAWTDHYDEMAKKTVFKRASKWVPLSAEIKNVLEGEDDDLEEKNVTPKPSLAGLIGAETEATPRVEKPDTSAVETTATVVEEKKPEAAPAVPAPAKTYTPEERAALLKQVEDLMFEHKVTEGKVLTHVHKNGLAKEGQDEVGTLETATLDALLTIVPTLAAAKK